MASRSMKNVLSVIATANGIALVIQRETKAAAPLKYAGELIAECDSAFRLWPGSLSSKELQSIYNRLAAFEQEHIPDRGRPEFLTSIALGLIDHLDQVIKDPVKRSALDRVGRALCKVHDYYDRTGRKWDTYDAAGKCIEHWNDERR